MKKIISVLVILLLAAASVQAANKANVKFGPIKFKATAGAAAVSIGNQTQITLGGSKGTTAGSIVLILEASEVAQLAKGTTFDVVTTNEDSTDDNAVTVIVQGTKTKIKGFSTTSTGITSNNQSTITSGTFKVVKYDEATKELKFVLKAKMQNYTLSKGGLGGQTNTEVNKTLNIVVQGVITLP